ncbi:LysR family transcriptional regulator [Martelella endophytica]|uniref:LysR family transcriptional regulator n=1 Tax=Martelella endophytica TaxID=1486262 RepID=A0A0D5LN95_MAREN|nr:LysR family transcriptional regulator [Martelella endophytica]AJY45252.1 LysR family transcriptional regulator [Martelella endophytica]
MDNRAGEMQVFQRVVEAGSFSSAARQLRMTPSTVSKLIRRIEKRLGVRLLERSTRRLTLTAEGELYYERSQKLLSDLTEVETLIIRGAGRASGMVRVNASVGLGTIALEPILPAFWEAYPDIAVDLSLSDEIVDLYLDHTDVAFRVGRLPDSGMMARPIGSARRMIVAAPSYLERYGTPRTLDELAQHRCLGFNFRRSKPVWPAGKNSRFTEQTGNEPLLANNGETVRRMAVAGAGLARIADFHMRDDLACGRLVEVLGDVLPPDREEINAVYLGGSHTPLRVQAFLDFTVPLIRAFIANAD